MINRLPDVFLKNRNEESGEDNFNEFVVPPFLNELEIKSQRKAIVIIGGRGCGKTTLLRYFCHATQFSPRRHELPESIFSHIGLYWRADTNFLNSFAGGGHSEKTWRSAFEHVLACELGNEIIRALRNINCNAERRSQFGLLNELNLSDLNSFDERIGKTLVDLEAFIQKSRIALSMWINNLEDESKPRFLPVELFLKTLVGILRDQLPYLADSTFAVFIDEYENLRDEQQRFINGLLKHGSSPLLYNVAMKRNGWRTQETLGPESIQEISDFRVINLEELLDAHFDLFAAELLFFRLTEYEPHLDFNLPIVPDQLRSIDRIDERYMVQEYRENVIRAAKKMLPRIGANKAAKEILKDSTLSKNLSEKIGKAIENRGFKLSPSRFIDDRFPEISVIMPALINRTRENLDQLLTEFDELRNGTDNRLSSTGDLVGNNLFACVNEIYLDSRRNSILYSGFNTLTLISKGNIRHLLELTYRIFKAYGSQADITVIPVVPPSIQARAFRDASESILGMVNGYGTYGPQLYSLTKCLGSIFRERHRSEKQSEPEINHFTIASGEVNKKLDGYLSEAEKWSVLFLSKETKMKSKGSADLDYMLNPIFAPYFQISYRKKRSLPITASQLLKILEGDQAVRDKLVRELGSLDASAGQIDDLFEGHPQ